MGEKKIGVFLCQCGGNISKTIDLDAVSQYVETREDVDVVKIHSNMCSGAGQKMIIEEAKEKGLNRIVIASCSPHFHEKTFKGTMEKAGLNPFVLELVNLREHCSWAHKDQPEIATEKAKDLVNAGVNKVREDYELAKKKIQMGNRVLVIGGGIAGIQAALDLADTGNQVYLVEKEPTIGGKMAILTKTFPTEDCSACIISPKMAAAQDHPNITLLTNSEIVRTVGHRLLFDITVEKKPRYIKPEIDMDQCLICEQCVQECPVSAPNKWEQGIMQRKAIYIPAALAIPFNYLIDDTVCLHFKDGSCNKCETVCPQQVIDFSQKPERIQFIVDSIIVATGYDSVEPSEKPMFGYDKFQNVVTGLEMERIVDHITENPPPRPVGKRIAFIQCVGSRDEQIGREYCSRVCCMYSVKLASLLKQAKPDKDIYIFYTDLRAFGKGFEEYYKRAQDLGIKFIRGKAAELYENHENKKVVLKAEDTLSRQIIESEFDLVVLAMGLKPNDSTEKIVNFLKLTKSSDGFLQEAHPKYKPVDTNIEGVFICGTAQGPKDIPDTVAQASAAAARVMVTLAQKEFDVDPQLAFVHTDICDGCQKCINACPKNAIVMKDGKAEVVEALCIGCGACIAACPVEALDFHNSTNLQMYRTVDGILEEKNPEENRLVIFADNTCTYRVADALGIRKMKYDIDARIIRVPSSARITTNLIVHAVKMGADAVVLGDCPAASSQFPWSREVAEKSIAAAAAILENEGIEGKRIYFEEFTAGDLVKFTTLVNGLGAQVKQFTRITEQQRKDI
ncbi:MAG: hydrogenase iron-sulfur subunit [Candidatus Cloacimonetes bacterium]|nr:hydrogenase iron-sulfur subunit [Candidatus Cloacimonadota bacterium]